MKKTLSTIALSAFAVTSSLMAQIDSPQPSPTATLQQTVGLTDFTVNYSRPGVKGRTVFGELVPFDALWRFGANHCTTLEASSDFTLEGKKIPAGTYGVFAIPTKSEWTIIISKQADLGGVSGYDKANDVVRFNVKTKALPSVVESFTIDFSNFSENGASLHVSWDKVAVSIAVGVNSDEVTAAQIKKHLLDGKEDVDAGSYHNAAVFYHKQGKDLDQALVWMNKSIEKNPKAFYYIYRKAELLADMGKKKEAIAAATQSLEMAKANADGDFGFAAKNEALIAKLKKK